MTLGYWIPDTRQPDGADATILEAVQKPREGIFIVQGPDDKPAVGFRGKLVASNGTSTRPANHYPLVTTIPPTYPEWLGDPGFCRAHRVRFPYIAGDMANGIGAPELVVAVAKADMLAFLGTAGLELARIERAIDRVLSTLDRPDRSWGANLIHNPNEPELEAATVALYLRRGVRRVSASAFMRLTPSVVRFACSGLTRDSAGRVVRQNHLVAKVSRPEVAALFMAPPPQSFIQALLANDELTVSEAGLAREVPLAEDVTVESDSAGHTDNRPLAPLFCAIADERDRLANKFGYPNSVRLGAAGGLGTPAAVASAFSLGAAYVLTGSINQCTVEAGTSPSAKRMLAAATPVDVAMAPAPDMFELGVKVQVLKRGTLYASRAGRLYELYRTHGSLDELPAEVRSRLEAELFHAPLEQIWHETEQYFRARNPAVLDRAANDPKHRMALVFRWYLGQSSRWAITGTPGRELDYQIWCGPAMGACNEWLSGSFLENPENRTAVQLARNLMEGAAVVTRAHQLRAFGLRVPIAAFKFTPRQLW